MEFTLGFFGGLGMTYAIITSEWPDKLNFSKNNNLLALIFVFIIIPLVNFIHAFTMEYFVKISNYQSIVDQEFLQLLN